MIKKRHKIYSYLILIIIVKMINNKNKDQKYTTNTPTPTSSTTTTLSTPVVVAVVIFLYLCKTARYCGPTDQCPPLIEGHHFSVEFSLRYICNKRLLKRKKIAYLKSNKLF